MFQLGIKHKIHNASARLQDLCLKVGIDVQTKQNHLWQADRILVNLLYLIKKV